MNSKVDFAAGGIVVDNNKVLLVKNRKSEYVDDPKSFWGFPKGHMEEGERLLIANLMMKLRKWL